MTLIEAALRYIDLGYSVIPIKGMAYSKGSTDKDRYKDGKRPLIDSWEPFQKERATKELVEEWSKKWPKMALAVVSGEISGIATVDCDTQEAVRDFEYMVPDMFETPTQITPRGGRQYVCRFQKGIPTKPAIGPGMDIRGEGGYFLVAPSANGKVYEWIDGYEPWTVSPAPLPAKVVELINASSLHVFKDSKVATPVPLFTEGRRDNDLFHVANVMVKGGAEPEYIREVLIRLVNSWGEHDQRWVEQKIKSALDRTEKKDRNLAEEVREWVMSTSGNFLSTDVHKILGLSTRVDMKNVSEIFARLRKEGLIAKSGTKNGCFRKLDQDLERIDFLHADEEEFKVHLPFEIERFVEIYPKNIIVVAGEPNAGKTAFLLNIALENQAYHETHVFSSEQGGTELKKRLSKFDFPLDVWTAQFWERSSDFADVIRPDAINIIDFLEIHKEFWEVGQMLKDIHDRLHKGIAIVALQKNPTRKAKDGTVSGEVGLGGMRGLEKPRLYLTMSTKNIIKIVKAKNWRTEFNPNGYSLRYTLARGCVFRQKGKWTKGEDIDVEDKYADVIVHED